MNIFTRQANWLPTIFILCTTFLLRSLPGQDITTKLSLQERQQVVYQIGDLLIKNYILGDAAQRCSDLLKQHWESGAYDHLSHPRQFVEKLTADIYSVLKDKHVRNLRIVEP